MFVVDAHLLLICHTLHFMLLLLLLSLDAHSHVDDYSSTLGGVRKAKRNKKLLKLLHCLKLLLKKIKKIKN